METKNLMKMAALVAMMSAGLTACSSDDDADTTVVSGSQQALDQACSDWKAARKNWEQSEAFLSVLPMSTPSIPTPTHGPSTLRHWPTRCATTTS